MSGRLEAAIAAPSAAVARDQSRPSTFFKTELSRGIAVSTVIPVWALMYSLRPRSAAAPPDTRSTVTSQPSSVRSQRRVCSTSRMSGSKALAITAEIRACSPSSSAPSWGRIPWACFSVSASPTSIP